MALISHDEVLTQNEQSSESGAGDIYPASPCNYHSTHEARLNAASGAAKRTGAVATRAETKTDIVLKKLRLARGVTVEALMEATGWQAHSVRGFLSGVVRKKLGLRLSNDIGKDGVRRYRIVAPSKEA